MKKFIVALLLIGSTVHAIAQDTEKQKTTKEAPKDEDTEDDTSEGIQTKRKPSRKKESAALGILGGLNESFLTYGGIMSPAKTGIALGGSLDIPLGGTWYLESGICYLRNGATGILYRDRFSGRTISSGHTWNINTLQLPVTFEVKFGRQDRARFYLGFGGYAAVNISGTVTPGTIKNGKVKMGNGNDDDMKALDAGIAINLGVQLKNNLFFRFRSQGGVRDLRPQPAYNGLFATSIRTSSSGFEIGYFFRKNNKHARPTDDVEMRM